MLRRQVLWRFGSWEENRKELEQIYYMCYTLVRHCVLLKTLFVLPEHCVLLNVRVARTLRVVKGIACC